MAKKSFAAISSAIIVTAVLSIQAVGKVSPIDSCKAAIDESMSAFSVQKFIKRIEDKGSSKLIVFRIEYKNAEGTLLKKRAECLSHDNGTILDLVIE